MERVDFPLQLQQLLISNSPLLLAPFSPDLGLSLSLLPIIFGDFPLLILINISCSFFLHCLKQSNTENLGTNESKHLFFHASLRKVGPS